LPELLLPVEDGGVLVVVVDDPPEPPPEELEVGAHDALTVLTGPVPGGTSADAGVPGGTLTLRVSV
jgi:hypothetical protein